MAGKHLRKGKKFSYQQFPGNSDRNQDGYSYTSSKQEDRGFFRYNLFPKK